ncbi:hypothetical protein B0H17DRAFT_1330870 [Mycena rosella]|uniref:Uncharacterized protein n=1 Tax=Mycena rosella TaxID=1033263 RepID=A0AAD7DI32_MYCRO|nr:hypothetical protein B0H17DRAFT_1330870 [Mycena rosella]
MVFTTRVQISTLLRYAPTLHSLVPGDIGALEPQIIVALDFMLSTGSRIRGTCRNCRDFWTNAHELDVEYERMYNVPFEVLEEARTSSCAA